MNAKNIVTVGLLFLIFCSTKSFGEENSSKEDVNKQLIAAVEDGDEKAVEELLKKGADPNTRINVSFNNYSSSRSVLYKAVLCGYKSIVIQLLSAGADIDAAYSNYYHNLDKPDFWIGGDSVEGITPLMAAIDNKQWELVSYLVKSGASVNAVSHEMSGNVNPFYKDKDLYRSVLDYALSENAPESIIDLLKSKGALTYKEIEEEREKKDETGKKTTQEREKNDSHAVPDGNGSDSEK